MFAVIDRLNRDQLEMLYRIVFEESKKALVFDEFGSAFAKLLGLEDDDTKRMFMKVPFSLG
jgi:hypothetical protein